MTSESGRAPRRRSDRMGVSREKEKMSWELFVNGATYQQIADTRHPATQEPLYGSWEAARQAVTRAMHYRANEAEVELVRAQRLAGLQAQRLDCLRQLRQVQPLFDRAGRPVQREQEQPDGSWRMVPVEDQQVRMSIHRTLVMIDRRIGALTGSDAAQKFELVPPAPPEALEDKKRELLERTATIRLIRPPEAIEAASAEVDRKEA